MLENTINHIEQLESESIHIIREAAANFKNSVLLYSIGKDSSVLLHLAKKAFYPGTIPFSLLHIDTGYEFPEMISFRDYIVSSNNLNLIVRKNESPEAAQLHPNDAHTDRYIYLKKTMPLLDTLKELNIDAAIGGARRDEEKSRAKERIFSIRSFSNAWDPKNQRPELWHLYNAFLQPGQTMRVFPLSNWTEYNVWTYINQERIFVVPLYFAKKRQTVWRNGISVRVDQWTIPAHGEEVTTITCRYRTLGCAPSTGVVPSTATTVEQIMEEIRMTKQSERQTRAIDHISQTAMEEKKRQGYF